MSGNYSSTMSQRAAKQCAGGFEQRDKKLTGYLVRIPCEKEDQMSEKKSLFNTFSSSNHWACLCCRTCCLSSSWFLTLMSVVLKTMVWFTSSLLMKKSPAQNLHFKLYFLLVCQNEACRLTGTTLLDSVFLFSFFLFLFFFFGCSLLASGWTGQLYSHAEGIHFTAADRLFIPRMGRTSGNAFKIHKYFVFLKPHSSELLQRRNLKYAWTEKKKNSFCVHLGRALSTAHSHKLLSFLSYEWQLRFSLCIWSQLITVVLKWLQWVRSSSSHVLMAVLFSLSAKSSAD